jgi:L-2-hydroxyglutarate oxidase LhgO
MQNVDSVIIGGGVVGLAVAAELARRFPGRSIVLLERNRACGQETSSRSSEVIHAGIYYARGTLRARLCVEGKNLLYQFCRRWDVPHSRIGKLIVAKDPDEAATLDGLMTCGRLNGVDDLEMLDRRQVKALEPHVEAISAVWSPSTGIIDSHGLTARLAWRAVEQGATIACRHTVTGIEKCPGGYAVRFVGPDSNEDRVFSSWVVNCAGLGAGNIASYTGIAIDRAGYRLYYCKGEYFRMPPSKGRLVSHLVYPPPYRDLLGLGIHVTKSLDGMTKLGPNAFYVDGLSYDVDPGHAREFYDGVREYLPFLSIDDLQPDTAGIRPKLQAPGAPACDFVIRHETDKGLPGFVNLIGIESPGLTSCLAIGNMVADMIEL